LETALATFVNVVLPLHINKLYTYRLPTDAEQTVIPGMRVAVQFGSKKIYAALVAEVHHTPPKDYEAKYVLNILDQEPVIGEKQLAFWKWMATYYLCSMGDVMNIALPTAFKLQSKTQIILNPEANWQTEDLDDREYLIIEALQIKNELSIDNIIEILQVKTVLPIIKSLHAKGIILFNENLEETYTPKNITCVRLTDKFQSEDALHGLFKALDKQPKQLQLVMAYLHLQHTKKLISRQLLLQTANVTAAPLNTLSKKGVFEIFTTTIDRIKIEQIPEERFELNAEQFEAYHKIKSLFNDNKPVLLHGVTGSGKTHVYVNLIKDTLSADKQVLLLLPEIALTSQIINRIKKYFGTTCIAFHSKYSNNERVEIWKKVLQGEINLVIGSRSSIFLPFQKLGLVIIDEEHETAYKQSEPAPRYHARDAAIYLAHMHGANCLLGSATPSFETYYNANTGKFGLVKLLTRYAKSATPLIEIINLAEEQRVKTMVGNYFSSKLFALIKDTIAQNEQVIIFQNRRGYAPVLECETCHWTPRCKHCDIALTYHKSIDSLKCHYCGYLQKVPSNCNACDSPLLKFKGFGTEKIEDEFNALLPNIRVTRLDTDSAKSKFGHEQIISDFENHKFDVLVGTQMISKGLDFGKVTLAAIINADQLLFFPDFRANERAFQLIQQLAGRTGRRDKQGKVLVQTNLPNSYVLQYAINNNYEGLYELELNQRYKFMYPPYSRLIKITVKHRDYKTTEHAAVWLKKNIAAIKGVVALGPESPYVSRIRNLFIKEILIKIERRETGLTKIKEQIYVNMQQLLVQKEYKNCIVFADVDPL
jgi:primosomal protein N' (replication factor Y)